MAQPQRVSGNGPVIGIRSYESWPPEGEGRGNFLDFSRLKWRIGRNIRLSIHDSVSHAMPTTMIKDSAQAKRALSPVSSPYTPHKIIMLVLGTIFSQDNRRGMPRWLACLAERGPYIVLEFLSIL